LRAQSKERMAFAPLSFVQGVASRLYYFMEEIWQDTINLRLEVLEVRRELERVQAKLAHLENRDRIRELAVQQAIMSEEQMYPLHSTRLPEFQKLAQCANIEAL
jgi:hypothetical protein